MKNLKESIREDIEEIEKVLKPQLSEEDMSTVMLAIGCIALTANMGERKDITPVIEVTCKYGTSPMTAIMGMVAVEIFGD